MLKLRKILLYDNVYYFFLILILIISSINLLVPKTSKYNEKNTYFKGIIIKIETDKEKTKLYLKNKETVIVNYSKKVNLNLGDEILVKGTFKKPSKNTTKNLFNYQQYLQRKNIFYLIDAKKINKIKSNSNIFYKLKKYLYNNFNNNPYLLTFILGDKSLIKENVIRSYQENGISHLFAISGMHISMFAYMLRKFLSKLSLNEENIFYITTIFLLIYLILVGLSPSILRGILFYILFSLNKIYYFYIKQINLFIISFGLCLLINPNYIFDVGFAYSFFISFALILMTKNLNSTNYLISLLKVSILSFIVSIPITLYNFYQINLLSIFYNLFFVPLVSFLIFPLAIISAFLKPVRQILDFSVYVLENISLNLSKISFLKLTFKKVFIIFYLLYLILIIFYLFTKKYKYLKILLIFLIIHFLVPNFEKKTYLKMIDIGQGDAILFRSHNKNVLIDTGGVSSYSSSNNDGKIFFNIIYPTFKSLGIKKLDYLILTHGDKDHLGEAKTLIENFKVKNIIINNNHINFYEQKLIEKNTIIGKQNLTFSLKDLSFIQLNENLDDENDSSQIYLVQYKNIKILLTGDASIKSEENLLNNYNLSNIDILKIGHHGSRSSTSDNFLKEIHPKIALISAGRNNKFNHPHQEVLERLNKYHVKTYCTKELGTLTINLDKMEIKSDL